MKRKVPVLLLTTFLSLLLPSCDQYVEGTILFDLNGGSFPESFHFDSLSGEGGQRVETDIPDPIREGYYFVGWRLLEKDGTYSEITTYLDQKTGESYYRFPYGDVTMVAYFEPLMEISFDLTEGKERSGALVAPENPSLYDADTSTLDGYTTMRIPSNVYLPTATAEHLNFEYWYTKYPLVETEDETGTSRFVLDTTKPEGEYRFDTGFESEDGASRPMAFPESEDGKLTLYASWTEDPKVTIHFGLEEYGVKVAPLTFLLGVGEDISAPLISEVKNTLGIDLSQAGYKYYREEGIDLRFAGAYLDEECTKPFPFPSLEADGGREDVPISTQDVEIYLNWSEKIDLTLDYGEGKVGEESSFHSQDYYVGDILGSDFASLHRPSKENAEFQGFTLNGESFDLSFDPLPKTDDGKVTLVATYADYPQLTVVVDYPDSALNVTLDPKRFPAGEDVSSYVGFVVNEEKADDYAVYDIVYQQKGDDGSYGEKAPFSNMIMPMEDTIVTIEMGYKAIVNIHPMVGVYGETYSEFDLSSALPDYETTRRYGKTYDATEGTFLPDTYGPEELDPGVESLPGLIDSKRQYFYEGIYADSELTRELLPSGVEIFRDQPQVIDVYLKFTQSIDVTLVYEDGSKSEETYTVLPAMRSEDFFAQIYGADFDLSKWDIFTALPDGTTAMIDGWIPSTDCTLTLRARN